MLARRAREAFGPVLYNLYGSTEIAFATIATPVDLEAEPGCVGRVVAGAVVEILDEEGSKLPRGQTGRIFVGNMLEFYDFITYSFFAIEIGHTFFPAQSEYGSLMLSLATFGAGFVTRPIGGIVLGILAALHNGRWPDKLFSAIAITGVSVPHYWFAIIMVTAFSVLLNWLPAQGMGDNGIDPQFLIMPVITLSLIPMGIVARLVRATGASPSRISARMAVGAV